MGWLGEGKRERERELDPFTSLLFCWSFSLRRSPPGDFASIDIIAAAVGKSGKDSQRVVLTFESMERMAGGRRERDGENLRKIESFHSQLTTSRVPRRFVSGFPVKLTTTDDD